jgi:hypothetical protein
MIRGLSNTNWSPGSDMQRSGRGGGCSPLGAARCGVTKYSRKGSGSVAAAEALVGVWPFGRSGSGMGVVCGRVVRRPGDSAG